MLLEGDEVEVSISSNLRDYRPRTVPVKREGGSYTYEVKVEIVNNEVVNFVTAWNIMGGEPGRFNITVTSLSNDPFMAKDYSRSTGSCEIELVSGSPVISDIRISPTLTTLGLYPDELYVSPGEDIVVECNVSSDAGLSSVKLLWSDGSSLWREVEMEEEAVDWWLGTVPGGPPNGKVRFYVEALSYTGVTSRTSEYECTFLDIPGWERDTNTIVIITAAVMVTGSVGILDLYRRRMRSKFL